ncbi:MAG: DUF4404 family protein [Gammaproteobacteria bacterium]|nr:DUF4404 family protein [Gammaproteobacteria bacterium]MDD9895852.1 DUF4404 family protein [Gammaproteobacteria bacterium]MDD9958801.1 DUF4404 family protein [Gammaproteobacteria bacterium]
MSEERVKELLSELIAELEKTDSIDKDVVESARKLETSVHDFVNPEIDTAENTILDDAIALEASFAATHPVAEKIIRELVNSLSRIGI